MNLRDNVRQSQAMYVQPTMSLEILVVLYLVSLILWVENIFVAVMYSTTAHCAFEELWTVKGCGGSLDFLVVSFLM